MKIKSLLRALFVSAFMVGIVSLPCYAVAAITPATIYNGGTVGDMRLTIAVFSAGTADDGDTWDSNISGIVACWTQDTDNPTTQGSVGVAFERSGDAFTFYPAEDNKPFTVFVLSR